MSQQSDGRAQVHHLKVTLPDLRPAVWRRLRVPSEVTLGELSDILRDAFEWDGDHLHKFVAGTVEYGPKPLLEGQPPGFGPALVHEDSIRLIQVAPRPGMALSYTYDLGDEWRHRIEVEDVTAAEPDTFYSACAAGRGLAPEQCSDDHTPGAFTEDDRLALNRRLRAHGALPGRELPVSAKQIDPVFAALFPWLIQGEGGERVLRPRQVAPLRDLAEQAAAAPLVRRALALAGWVGAGRPVTPGKVLRPDDAVEVMAKLGLGEPVLPELPEVLWRVALPAAPASYGVPRQPRSAKELPGLHGLWCAAVEAGLVEIRGSRAVAGDAAETWVREPVETWARLLAGLMRARVRTEQQDRSYYGLQAPQEAVFPLTAEIAEITADLADDPLPVLLPALPIAAATGDVMVPYGLSGSLLGAVHAAMSDWALAGAIEPTGQAVTADRLEPLAARLVREFWREDDPSADPRVAAEEFLRGIPRPALDAVYGSAAVRLSPLGAYGMRRLLTAHGWAVAGLPAAAGTAAAG